MRKLIWLLFLVAGNVFGQNYTNYTTTTTTRTTNTLVWNQYNQEWDFFDNHDKGYVTVVWKFVVDGYTETGTLIAGDLSYDILSAKKQTLRDGSTCLMFEIKAAITGKKLDLLISGTDGDVLIGVYDYAARTSYYYH